MTEQEKYMKEAIRQAKKAYDTARKLIMEQKQAAAKPVLNTTA